MSFGCPAGYHAVFDSDGTFLYCAPDGDQGGGGSSGGGGAGGGGLSVPPPSGVGAKTTTAATVPPFLVTAAGTKLTKASYDALVANYRHEALIYGVTLTNAEANELAKGDVSAAEFQTRLQLNQSITDNADHFDQFKSVLAAQGIKWNGDYKDRLAFITGQAQGQFYKVWDEYAARAAAVDAGYGVAGVGTQPVNQDLRLQRSDILDLEKKLNLDPTTVDPQQFASTMAQAAQWAITNLPASRYKGYGLDNSKLLQIAAGVGDATAQASLQRLIGEQAAFVKGQSGDTFQSVSGGGSADASLQGL
jgi:hypothetical protein